MLWNKNKLFCDINPFCYAISQKKEILKRHLKNIFSDERFSKKKSNDQLEFLISEHSSCMIKRAPGVELELQLNKAVNINLACKKIDGTMIYPGETFSFWKTVGKTTKRKGYLDGRIIRNNKVIPGMGGGLCNLGNTLHLLILHSPLDVTEFHKHSDALAPDEGKRVPFSSGTSISYNNIDYRFKNNTDQIFQLCTRCEGETLVAELRSDGDIPYRYELTEEDHHFRKEDNGKYYRVSKIYRNIIDKETEKTVKKELILDNHSEVMYQYDLIPKEMIRA